MEVQMNTMRAVMSFFCGENESRYNGEEAFNGIMCVCVCV
jgi:hypothetical protein